MRAVLTALRDKYARLIALRAAQAAGSDADARAELSALAGRFPGALRELDRRALGDLGERLEALTAAISGDAPVPPWAPIQAGYHGAMRAALRLRPALRGCSSGSEAIAYVRARYVPLTADEPRLEDLDEEFVAGLWRPPTGRLNPVVLRYVARAYGIPSEGLESMLFGGTPTCGV